MGSSRSKSPNEKGAELGSRPPPLGGFKFETTNFSFLRIVATLRNIAYEDVCSARCEICYKSVAYRLGRHKEWVIRAFPSESF
jgi:hypothetical protein